MFMALSFVLFTQETWAQFEKSSWPRAMATPALSFTDVQQKRWTPEAFKGRVVILNFWATWCEPCKEELPSLDALAQLEGDEKVLVLGINVNEPPSRAIKYLTSHGLALHSVSDQDAYWARAFNVRVYPTTILMDTKGQARFKVVGAVDWTSEVAKKWIEGLQ